MYIRQGVTIGDEDILNNKPFIDSSTMVKILKINLNIPN